MQAIKAKADSRFTEARKTGWGSNSSGNVDGEKMLILAVYTNLTKVFVQYKLHLWQKCHLWTNY